MQELDVGTVVDQAIDVLATWGLKVVGALAVLLDRQDDSPAGVGGSHAGR